MNIGADKEKQPFVSLRARWILGAVILLPLLVLGYSWVTFPSDRTPEGAYLRVVRAVNLGKPKEFFAYTEEAAQHACYTIGDYRQKLLAVAQKGYPKAELAALTEKYGAVARAPDGSDVFAVMAHEHGWLSQLRLDVSGISKVEQSGERASVITVKGTRYAFRRRPNGIWGLTAFTPTLVDEAEKAARDLELVTKAAADFARARAAEKGEPSSPRGNEP